MHKKRCNSQFCPKLWGFILVSNSEWLHTVHNVLTNLFPFSLLVASLTISFVVRYCSKRPIISRHLLSHTFEENLEKDISDQFSVRFLNDCSSFSGTCSKIRLNNILRSSSLQFSVKIIGLFKTHGTGIFIF